MHKHSKLSTVNLINYMSSPWPGFYNHRFLGFVPISGGYDSWGIVLDNIRHCAVHSFKTREGFFWGDDPEDTAKLASEKPWVLMYYGNDNSSFFQRFITEKDAFDMFKTIESIDPFAQGVMRYNS